MTATHASEYAAMYTPIAPATAPPRCAAIGSTRANTPTGAANTTHRTISSIASPSARARPTSGARVDSGLRAIAMARISVNRMSGTIAPFAAAATGFGGINDVSHALKPGVWPPADTALAAWAAPAGSAGFAPAVDGKGRSANNDGASGMTIAAV